MAAVPRLAVRPTGRKVPGEGPGFHPADVGRVVRIECGGERSVSR